MGTKLLYFSAKWCGPCKTQWPITEKVAEELSLSIEKLDIDIETNVPTAKEYGISSIPTLIVLSDRGFEKGRLTGVINSIDLKAKILRCAEQ